MRLGVRGALGLFLSALLLWWVLKDVDLRQVWRVLAHSNALLWLACTAAATAIFPLRARRWQALLAPVAGRLPFAPLWQSTAVGMMVNNVMPFRAGEFARAFAVSRAEPRVRFTAAVASLAVDRLFDGTVVLLLMLLAMLDPAFPSGHAVGDHTLGFYLRPTAIFLGAVLVGLVLFVVAPHRVFDLSDAVVRRIAPKLEPRVRTLLEGFVSGLDVLRSPRLLGEVFLWTVLHWLCNALAFWLGFRALGLAVPASAALFLQGLIAIGVALPSTPGFVGVFEAGGVLGLTMYGVPQADALGWALGFHVLSYIPITVLGSWYLSRLHLHFKDFSRAKAAAVE
ncbi:MAG TPA: lysylphosphatidylglycerol synthase transmembrane domain-containing protein [Gemmatimonadaceae bacterium]|nr:lysylphosphatidylglycerol synthase transmembrane domain-containing protein [Gemmatimonadaceae bacterium]